MSVSRRQFIKTGTLGALSAWLVGCVEQQVADARRPEPLWPNNALRPQQTAAAEHPALAAAPQRPSARPTARIEAGLPFVARDDWARAQPIPNRLNPMGSIGQITVHHEGWTPVWFDDETTTAKRLEAIRREHLRRMGAGDIGYHFVIDRAGRVWQGRPVSYQGAHVKEHNEHNLGIMVLGNFDLQRPSDAQLGSLNRALTVFAGRYRVPAKRMHTHRELNPTTCPGDNLQVVMNRLRSSSGSA